MLLNPAQFFAFLIFCMRNEAVYVNFPTQTIELKSDASLVEPNNKTFAAVSVTLHVWEKVGSYAFSFLPVRTFVDLEEVCSPPKSGSNGFDYRYCPYNSSCANVSKEQLSSTTADVAKYWLDRSVVVFNLASVNIPDEYPCLQMAVCGVNRCEDETAMTSGTSYGVYKYSGAYSCNPHFGYFSTHCREPAGGHATNSSSFLVSQALLVSISPTPLLEFDFDASISFVASIGYRPMPGVFECPRGMFLCRPLSTCSPPYASDSCSDKDRVCLPNSLRCDNHINCPGTTWDEDNCPVSPVSASMSWHPEFPAEELSQMRKVLGQLDEKQLWLAGYRLAPATASVGSSYLLISLLVCCCLVSICAAGVICIRRRRRKQADSDAGGGGEARRSTEVQPYWPADDGGDSTFAPLLTITNTASYNNNNKGTDSDHDPSTRVVLPSAVSES